jgi:hypothetical protein
MWWVDDYRSEFTLNDGYKKRKKWLENGTLLEVEGRLQADVLHQL